MTARYKIRLKTVHAIAREGEPSEPIDGPDRAAAIVRGIIDANGWHDREVFLALAMDARGRIVGQHVVAIGTLTACLVHPREVFAPMIVMSAASIIVAHTHPSGDATPSDEDYVLTDRLDAAGDILGIPVTDHLVVTRTAHQSARRAKW